MIGKIYIMGGIVFCMVVVYYYGFDLVFMVVLGVVGVLIFDICYM